MRNGYFESIVSHHREIGLYFMFYVKYGFGIFKIAQFTYIIYELILMLPTRFRYFTQFIWRAF